MKKQANYSTFIYQFFHFSGSVQCISPQENTPERLINIFSAHSIKLKALRAINRYLHMQIHYATFIQCKACINSRRSVQESVTVYKYKYLIIVSIPPK